MAQSNPTRREARRQFISMSEKLLTSSRKMHDRLARIFAFPLRMMQSNRAIADGKFCRAVLKLKKSAQFK
jgi:hypothetical protein